MDLAEPELQIANWKILTSPLSEAEVEAVIAKNYCWNSQVLASMGKVMGLASAQLSGTAEGNDFFNCKKKLV
jgi:uncharacterized protein YqeY